LEQAADGLVALVEDEDVGRVAVPFDRTPLHALPFASDRVGKTPARRELQKGVLAMAELVADYVLKRLREWDVHRIYGYPGDGINAFLGALDRADGDPDFIQARHEEMAAFMACGHAKFAGPDTLGVCMATSGPGAIHLLNGL